MTLAPAAPSWGGKVWPFLVLMSLMVMTPCWSTEPDPDSPPQRQITGRLGISLLQQLSQPDQPHVVISPYSLSSALLMTWNGAAGRTRAAIGETLGLDANIRTEKINRAWTTLDRQLESGGREISLQRANSLWLRKDVPLRADFVDRVQAAFAARAESLDFAAADASGVIDRWIEEQTDGKITAMAPDPIPPDAVLYLINAIHFQGRWTDEFDVSDTKPREFVPHQGPPRQVPMMERFGSWRYGKADQWQAVRLPYGAGEFAMYIVLPAKGQLEPWLTQLSDKKLNLLIGSLKESEGRVIVPRFKIDFDAKLRQPLSKLGMAPAFGSAADFSALTSRPVGLSEVLHKVSIDVNEQGSEGAAATVVEVVDVAVDPTEPFELVVNRPFFFAIRHDKSGMLMFAGLVRSLM